MDISQSNWNEADASNTTAAPDGAPEGMAPSGVNDTLRAVMGAIKRWYDQLVPATTAGTSTAYTLTYSVSPNAMADGMTFLVKFHTACGASATLNINTLGAKPLVKWQGGAWVAVAANDIATGQKLRLTYDSGTGNLQILPLIGTAAQYNVGTAANNLVQLDGSAKLPAVDGSALTNIQQFTTGDWKFTHKTTADSGWIMWVDGTIGSASSGATVRANADAQALYELYWNGYIDTICPVTGGRGASATADFTANKPLQIPKGPGRTPVIAGSGAGLTARTAGANGGAETASGSANTLTAVGDTHADGGGTNATSAPNHFHGVTITVSTMQPFTASNAMIKL